MRWIVTGANRGIGLEFARQLVRRGDTVEASARAPETASDLRALSEGSKGLVRVHTCDVVDGESVEAFGRAVGPGPVDVLINNAGVMGSMTSIADLDFADLAATFNANALGALRVTRVFLDRILESQPKRIVSVTSGMGSITDNGSGGAYGYRMSKAALNMANKSLSVDLAAKKAVCVVVNPGWVKTDMGGSGASLSVEDSVKKMLSLIDALGPEDTGRFLNVSGADYSY